MQMQQLVLSGLIERVTNLLKILFLAHVYEASRLVVLQAAERRLPGKMVSALKTK